jgi:hypothetical protein
MPPTISAAKSVQLLQRCCDGMSPNLLSLPEGDPGQFYSMYKHTTVQKLNRSKRVTVGVWASTTQTTHTTGFIPNFHLDTTGKKNLF